MQLGVDKKTLGQMTTKETGHPTDCQPLQIRIINQKSEAS